MSFMRFDVEVDVTKPIISRFFHRLGARDVGKTWVQFRYKHLVDICYKCGSFRHLMSIYKKQLAIDGNRDLYGSWLCAKLGAHKLDSKCQFRWLH